MSFTVTDKRGKPKEAPKEAPVKGTPPWFPVFVQFESERLRQLDKWGMQNGKRIDGTGNNYDKRVAEEFQRQNDARHNAGKPGVWRKILLEEVYEAMAEPTGEKLFHELKQSGAVITAWMEDLIFRGVVDLAAL